MSLKKLASELEETARQTGAMVDGIFMALATLSDKAITSEKARQDAIAQIVTALQAQDRIEQRCRNMAIAARHFAQMPRSASEAAYDAVWHSLTLDELRIPSLTGIAARVPHGEPELF
jgi:CO/xanthine dehydrogenase FAD-binding subunit